MKFPKVWKAALKSGVVVYQVSIPRVGYAINVTMTTHIIHPDGTISSGEYCEGLTNRQLIADDWQILGDYSGAGK